MKLIRSKQDIIDVTGLQDCSVDPQLLRNGEHQLYHSLRRWLQRQRIAKPRKFKSRSDVPLNVRQAAYDATYRSKHLQTIPEIGEWSLNTHNLDFNSSESPQLASKGTLKNSSRRKTSLAHCGWPHKLTEGQQEVHLIRAKKFRDKNFMSSTCPLCCEFFWSVLRRLKISGRKKASIVHLVDHGAGKWTPNFVELLKPYLDSIYSNDELSEIPWVCGHENPDGRRCSCLRFNEVYSARKIVSLVIERPGKTAYETVVFSGEFSRRVLGGQTY